MNNKYFVLGDSRTGTTSLHQFFLSAGVNSIHHFEKEANVVLPYADENYCENSKKIVDFIANCGYNAFSDYPTRLFYKVLYEKYPSAYFILTLRNDLDTWKKSMKSYFEVLGVNYDEHHAVYAYTKLNDDIINFFKFNSGRFVVINIDNQNEENELKLNGFTGLKGVLGRYNTISDHLEFTQNSFETSGLGGRK